jgi:hypothetical protein
MFPKLAPGEIDRLRRFGQIRRYAAGAALFLTGDVAPGMYVLIKGRVHVTRRDPLGHKAPIVEQGGQKDVVFLLRRVEECTNVPMVTKRGMSKPNRNRIGVHSEAPVDAPVVRLLPSRVPTESACLGLLSTSASRAGRAPPQL